MSKKYCGDYGGTNKAGEPCGAWAGSGTDFEDGKCKHHRGTSPDGESHENNDNAVTHGLHQSAETFFANADEHHLDTYYAMHESLCWKFEKQHGHEPLEVDKKELAMVALDMAKLDMATEYEKAHAVDDSHPLTEQDKRMSEAGPWHKEVISKVEDLKTDIRRENRLLLKDKGIYSSPEAQQAAAGRTLAEVLSDAE